MILLTTRHTQEKLERALEISKKKANDASEYVGRLEGKIGSSINRHPNPGITEIMILQRQTRPLKTQKN